MSQEAIVPWVLFIVILPTTFILAILFIAAFKANTQLKQMLAMQNTELNMLNKNLNEARCLSELRRNKLIAQDRMISQCQHCSGLPRFLGL